MGRYKNGAFGAFTGKIGNLVGSTWNGIHYMRSVPAHRKDAKTEKQLAQRQRFRLMTSFLRKFRAVVNIGFKKGTGNMAASNRAMSYNIKNAISGDYPDYEVQYENLMLSRGELTGSHNASAESGSPGEITLTWKDNSGEGSASPDDMLVVALYNTERETVFYSTEAAERQDESVTLELPGSYEGTPVEAYIFFVSPDEEWTSDSDYLGSVTIQEQV